MWNEAPFPSEKNMCSKNCDFKTELLSDILYQGTPTFANSRGGGLQKATVTSPVMNLQGSF